MLAPWAPVLRVVWRTVRATGRVRAMMRARGGRNRLTAILREYLFLGLSALSIRAVGWSLGMVDWPVSPAVPDDLLPASTPGMVRELIDQALAGAYGQPLSPRSLQGGLWTDMARLPYLAHWDPLAWWWSRDVEVVLQSMRQAVFVDNTGLPIESRPPLSADGDAAAATAAQTSAGKDVSDDVLTLLFLLSRSLLGGVDALEGVRRRVVTALDRPHWWLRY
ncbi:hypothetical protein I4F81_005019 [Pyropia yezoensis]|uniref:Uncharacterized protein n=1 Tax=Pyropia yezoensis TaxID=2788 RepID=A0ACC3BXG9_PYRYE|nr:hypothetical protein I4F81_005019 [Neopyropia yezoensis]